MQEIQVDVRPETRSNLRVKFFWDNDADMVEIAIVGDTSTVIRRVTPEDLAKFAAEWTAYEAGTERVDHGGTPLTEVPGIDQGLATAWRLKGVHNVEQFVTLSEIAVRSLGMDAITKWKTAKLLMASKEAEVMQAVKRGPGRPRKDPEPETEAA